MILYSDKALERLGVSAEQMETKIADELPTTTEAAANSLVNLEFNLAHTGKVGDRRPNEPRRLLSARAVDHSSDGSITAAAAAVENSEAFGGATTENERRTEF